MQRAKCVSHFSHEGRRDPELTFGRFYPVKNCDTRSMAINDQPYITVQGNSGVDIERPASSFIVFGRKGK